MKCPVSGKVCEVTELEIFGLLGCLLWTSVKKCVDKTRHLFLKPFTSWPFKLVERTVQRKQTSKSAYLKKKVLELHIPVSLV